MNISLIKQFLKYFGAALIGYVVDFGTLLVLTEFYNVHYLISATVGFCLGLVVVYVISKLYVFGESRMRSKKQEFVMFALIGVIGLALLNIIMWLLTSNLGVNYIISKLVATIIVYTWNFSARRSLYTN